jgi:GMP reductase
MDLSALADELGVRLISDGGMTNPGDAMKAFAAGASFVMAGSYFAGHDETGAHFHGMSSHGSRTHRGQERADYRASEGREVMLAPRGSLVGTVQEFLGGLRSSCMYLGVRRLEQVRTAPITASRVYQQLNRIEGISPAV